MLSIPLRPNGMCHGRLIRKALSVVAESGKLVVSLAISERNRNLSSREKEVRFSIWTGKISSNVLDLCAEITMQRGD